MGCCVQRGKLDSYNQVEAEFFMLNSLPTYDNITYIYQSLSLPDVREDLLPHKKEQMLLMIINLLRTKPKIFLSQMEHMKSKCDKRQKPRNIVFLTSDVEASINILQQQETINSLELSDELCSICREQFQLYKKMIQNQESQNQVQYSSQITNQRFSSVGPGPEGRQSNLSKISRQTKQKLMQSHFSFQGVKEMVIDFICREDLLITTLKEFFEIFISSIKKEQQFHKEILSQQYNYIGLGIDFNSRTSIATIRILLAADISLPDIDRKQRKKIL